MPPENDQPLLQQNGSYGARVGTYVFDAPERWEHESIEVVQTGKLLGGVFIPSADVWAIRKRGWCLNRDGDWEFEPLPSSRDDEFFARCRFTLAEALPRAQAARNADNLARSDAR